MGQLRKGTADGKLKLLETAEQRKRRLQGNQDAEGQLVKRLKGAAAKGALKAGMAMAPRVWPWRQECVGALLAGLATGVGGPAEEGWDQACC
jgi:hypothetical protein